MPSTPDYSFELEDPPPSARPSDVPLIANMHKLMNDHPGEYGRIASYNNRSSGPNKMRNLQKRPLLPGRWEFSARTEGEMSRLWAKYLGPAEPVEPTSDDLEQRRRNAAADATS